MPIRSPRGRAAAYRALWQWPLRSPARLGVTVVLVLAVIVGVGLAIGATRGIAGGAAVGGAPPTTDSTSRAAPRTQAPGTTTFRPGSPTPTALPAVPDLQPTTLPPSRAPAAALQTAARWSGAWLRPPDGTTAQQWLDGLRATTTEEYLGVLGGVDPANIPATRVTGEPRPRRVAPKSVQVEVQTDALTLLVLVVNTESGWRVAGYDRA